MHTAFEELKTARLHRLDELLSCRSHSAFWGDIEREVRRPAVD